MLAIETELPPPGDLTASLAHWVFADSIAWEVPFDFDGTYSLHWAAEGGMTLAEDGSGVVGGESVKLEYVSDHLNSRYLDQHPYLANKAVLEIPAETLPLVPEILKGQVIVSLVDAEGKLVDATRPQIPFVLDDLYHYEGALGVTWAEGVPALAVWGPTARIITLHLFPDANPDTESTTVPMTLDPVPGVWSVTGDASWNLQYYLYEVEVYVPNSAAIETNLVTDPYSLSLSMNSTRSQMGRNFVSENTLRHSRSRLSQGFVVDGVAGGHQISCELNMWEYAGSLRYNLATGGFQPFVKAGYGLSWYRMENALLDTTRIGDGNSRWIRKPSLWENLLPNTFHIGAGLEFLPISGVGTLDWGLRLEGLLFTHNLGTKGSDNELLLVSDRGITRWHINFGTTISF